ncbi:MAG: hypothetical protein E3J72_01480 [Planctomycetota bacterium]|nr:MAG: hypothetical protein E3J72_01480 [Planctomycetota bacterium]
MKIPARAALVIALMAVLAASAFFGCTHKDDKDPNPMLFMNPDLFNFYGPSHVVVVEFTATEM